MSDEMTGTYPEHEKLLAVKDQTQVIGEFLEWLASRGIQLMRPSGHENIGHDGWLPDTRSISTILADWAGIDEARLEREKRAMLERLQGK